MQKKRLSKEDTLYYCGSLISVGCAVVSILCLISSLNQGWASFIFTSLAVLNFRISIISAVITASVYFIKNKFYISIEYGKIYSSIIRNLRNSLIEAEYYEIDLLNYVKLPKIEIELSDDFQTGIIKIENSLHFNKGLEKDNISSALDNYVIERWYLSADQNYYVYEIYDVASMFPRWLHSLREYRYFVDGEDDYHLRLDNRSIIKLQHCLICGSTRTGKTYLLYSMLLQMKLKKIKYNLYFADPKNSSLLVLGRKIGLECNSYRVEDIAADLRRYHLEMLRRAQDMAGLLQSKIDSDYRKFGLEPHVFVFDEYASFMGSVALLSKPERDEIQSIIRDVVLMGAQLGFFIIIVMQKSDATTINTMIRDNLTCKVVMGNAEDTTYITAFGNGVEIPKHEFKVGEGVFTNSGYVNSPKLLTVPTLDFDILGAFEDVTKGAETG